jgi:hypothetical protein
MTSERGEWPNGIKMETSEISGHIRFVLGQRGATLTILVVFSPDSIDFVIYGTCCVRLRDKRHRTYFAIIPQVSSLYQHHNE